MNKYSEAQHNALRETIKVLETMRSAAVNRILTKLTAKDAMHTYDRFVQAYFDQHKEMELKPGISFAREMAVYIAATADEIMARANSTIILPN